MRLIHTQSTDVLSPSGITENVSRTTVLTESVKSTLRLDPITAWLPSKARAIAFQVNPFS